jgi:hypothetical protein
MFLRAIVRICVQIINYNNRYFQRRVELLMKVEENEGDVFICACNEYRAVQRSNNANITNVGGEPTIVLFPALCTI